MYLVYIPHYRHQNSVQFGSSGVRCDPAAGFGLSSIILSSRLLTKNLKIKIYRTIILPVVLYESET